MRLRGKPVTDAELSGIKAEGPIGLQQHGGFDAKTRRWRPASSCIQFRSLSINVN